MDRRTFISSISVSLLATRLAGGAQQTAKVYRIGYLSNSPGPTAWSRAFAEGMRELGYIEGQNLIIEYRWSSGNLELLARHAGEIVGLGVDLIVASPTTGALAAKQATKTIPIVVPISVDAVRAGVVDNLARPGGNVTGLTLMSGDLISKRLELLKTAVPTASRLAFLSRAGIPQITTPLVRELEAATRALQMTLHVLEPASFDDKDIDSAFETIARKGADSLYVLESPTLAVRGAYVMTRALKHRLPVIGGLREYVDAGVLLFYGPNDLAMHRRAAVFADKILKGAKPDDLPMEQPTKFALVINLKTAKALGLTIPQSLLVRADEVVQ